MKSLDILPFRPRGRAATSFDDDEPTVEICTVAGAMRAPVIAVAPTAPIGEVRALLAEVRVPAILVVDRGELAGLITRTDILRAAPDAHAVDAMSHYVLVLPVDATVERAAALMATEGVGQVVIVDDAGEVAGIVSALDIARHVARRAGFVA